MVTALALPLVPNITPERYGIAISGVILLTSIAAAVVGWRRANRLLRERLSPGS